MNIISAIENFINSTNAKINKIAKSTKFLIRRGKLKPETFFMLLTIGQSELHEVTLDSLAEKSGEYQNNLKITKQGLYQRMETGSELMKEIYNQTTLENTETGELHIKDLGYYDGRYFEEIDKKQAYFLSKIKKDTKLYEYKGMIYEEIDIAKMLKKSNDMIDRKIFIKKSSGKMYELRLTGMKLPQKIRDEKKRQAYKTAKKQGKQLTEKEIQMLEWFLVITNVSTDMLDVKTIGELYRLRWPIILISALFAISRCKFRKLLLH
jgi:hypothetical protein